MNTRPRRPPAGGASSSTPTLTSNDAHTLTTNDGQHLDGGNTAGDIATWQADLYLLQRDALALQGSPAPSCAGGTELTRAADAWAEAATDCLAAARILGSSPDLTGISQSDGNMTTGNNSLSRAKRALNHAVSDSGGLIIDITKGTGT